ncbi:glycosyltransferase family 39 protein [Actinospica sp. MGRD01-02]|uniref:Glycosyltransferase family 39 protein n=1 Tax=Actinospica acidithermotolerans TaxID=2828514 RepID=A0A941EBY0_9ACTN|nr:glycosyltransferase family 39 protein [Actinospica acidithermotolerans]MBR7827628.1 glycosyltransferase family 39 protein [Actinospica acidithermotolerans]
MAITATQDTTVPASEPPRPSRFRPSRDWLFPADQPRWARPGLLAVAALAALIFTWGAFHTATNNFYAADARSMSMSWKNFLYGAFDPAGSVTIDKLWGFLWPQALAVKIFGYHAWALALPEAIEGVISVLVLYRLARRWTGRSDVALLSAGLFTLTPIVAATFGHSGLEDNALTMCLILATDAFQRAANEGRLRSLALSGFWIGMAFQTKMVQAWTVVPIFGLVYLICAPHPLLKRIRHTLAFGAVTAVASLWLMVVVQLTPAADRPFIDGSNGSNNIFTMVFDYNFTSRFGSLSSTTSGGSFGGGGSDWGKLLGASFASQIGWLYPLALIALVFGLIKARGAGRADGVRAGYLMWGGTLGITALAFSAGTIPHSQYMTVLAPGLAALGAAGIVGMFRAFRDGEKLGWLLPAAIAATVLWATRLSYENTVFLSWLPPLVIALGLASILLLIAYRVRRIGKVLAAGIVLGTAAMVATPAAWALSTFDTSDGYNGTSINAAAGPYSGQFGSAGRTGGMSGGPGGSGSTSGGPGGTGQMPGGSSSDTGSGSSSGGLGGAPSGGFPGSSSGSSGSTSSGSSNSGAPSGGFPGSSSSESGSSGAPSMGGGGMGGGGGSTPGGSGSTLSTAQEQLLTYLKAHQGSAKYLFAVMSSGDAEDYIANAGASVLPVGGFSGNNGYPSLAQFKELIAKGELKYVLLSSSGGMGAGMGGSGSGSTSAIESWVKANCKAVSSSSVSSSVGTLYVCSSS